MPVPTIQVTRPRPIDGHAGAPSASVASVPTSAPAIAVTAMATTSAKASTRRDRSTRKLGQARSTQRAGDAPARCRRAASVQAGVGRPSPRPSDAAEEQRRPGPDAEQRQRGEADAGHRPQPRHVRLGADEVGAHPRRQRRRRGSAPACSTRYRPMVRNQGRRSSHRGASMRIDAGRRVDFDVGAEREGELAIDVADRARRATPARRAA